MRRARAATRGPHGPVPRPTPRSPCLERWEGALPSCPRAGWLARERNPPAAQIPNPSPRPPPFWGSPPAATADTFLPPPRGARQRQDRAGGFLGAHAPLGWPRARAAVTWEPRSLPPLLRETRPPLLPPPRSPLVTQARKHSRDCRCARSSRKSPRSCRFGSRGVLARPWASAYQFPPSASPPSLIRPWRRSPCRSPPRQDQHTKWNPRGSGSRPTT